jgi:hypothetical protein
MVATEDRKYTRVFGRVFLAELDYVKKRRESMRLPFEAVNDEARRLSGILEKDRANDPDKNQNQDKDVPRFDARPSSDPGLVGLALSGGGIRSATFNLGLLQALARSKVLHACDYISTVSGGGYIGSCLSSLLDNSDASTEKERFPFRFQRRDDPDERKEVKHLRKHGNYLSPNRKLLSLDTWRMIGVVLSGIVLTNIVTFSIGIIIAYLFHLICISVPQPLNVSKDLLCLSLIILGIMIFARALAASKNLGYKGRCRTGYVQAWMALTAAFLAAVAGLIALTVYLPEATSRAYNLLHGISLASVLGLAAGLLRSENEVIKKIARFIFYLGVIALLPVLFAQLLRFLWATEMFAVALWGWPVLIWVAILLIIASLFINTNRITLHHFYRDRLSEAYIIKRVKKGKDVETIESNEPLTLKELHKNLNGPYHLINATLNVPSSKDRYLRGRGADFFMFSKYFCGSESTGYRSTDDYAKGEVRLATAMAVSGAAASPQMGFYTSPVLTFIMTLLNVRLNRWMPNPDPERTRFKNLWPYYFVKELLCLGKETDSMLNLSDGGHHENLGIYPLLKRHLKVIIASDAAADPEFEMADLANLQRKARIDLGIDIDIQNKGDLCPDKEKRYTKKRYLRGTIRYPDGKEGVLFYMKTTLTGDEPEDLLAYRRKNPSFPDQTTADQFFDEAQFESYRKLGELMVEEVFHKEDILAFLFGNAGHP